MKVFLKKKQNLSRIFIGICLIILLLFLLNFFQKEVRSFFYFISSPVQKTCWRVGDSVSDFFTSFMKTTSLKKEKDELNLKNQELEAKIASLNELKQENETLRQALGIDLQKDFKLSLAKVIGKDVSQDFLLIDKGSNDDISKNMPVITQQKVLVGRISEVYNSFSKVALVSNKQNSFDGKLQEKDISGLIRGKGGFKIIFDLVPRDKEISQGERIVTSNLGGVFPAGILVGKIKNVQKNDTEPFLQIEIEPAFNIGEIDNLFLILNQ